MKQNNIPTSIQGSMVQPSLNAVLNNLPMHYNWYIRGITNAFLPAFLNPLETKITERSVNGESLSMLRDTVKDFYPNLPEGAVASLTYEMINDRYDLKNIFSKSGFDAETFEESIKMSLGRFAVAKENGKYVIYDTYDFPEVGEWEQFSQLKTAGDYANQVIRNDGDGLLYFGARYFAERFMNESQEDNLKVRIELPEEDEVIATDYDNEPQGQNFVFRGAMTSLRKKIWDTFTEQTTGRSTSVTVGQVEPPQPRPTQEVVADVVPTDEQALSMRFG